MVKYLESKTNALIKYVVSLKDSKKRKSEKMFLIEGRKILDIALATKLVTKVFTLKELPLSYDVEQYVVSEEIMKKISHSVSPEGIVAICKYPVFDENSNKNALFLDNIQDPGNLGTIIRTATAFDYSPIYISSDTVDPFNEKVISASKGAVLVNPVFYKKFSELDQYPCIIVSTLSNDSISLKEVSGNKKHLLVIGNEAHGVRDYILEKADIKVKIDMENFESLNAAVAAGIMMYDLSHK